MHHAPSVQGWKRCSTSTIKEALSEKPMFVVVILSNPARPNKCLVEQTDTPCYDSNVGLTQILVMQTETLYYGDRKISIRTSVLEEKATACNMLCCYADELEVGFFPYVEQVTLDAQ